ncbi:MAG: M14 family zinc carboxypeptidase, partial [Gemmatimonadota bacterium]|nr:M14 family zinc carboxypeptidase [Gemmatimonadota bacterium]
MKHFVVILGFLSVAGPVSAQVPTFSEVVGHEFGQRITEHHQMVSYLEALAAASPRVTISVQGQSWEGRDLMLAVVTSPENHARLDEIKENARRLADPRTTSLGDAEAIIADQPAIQWFGGSIHGFELSGSEGALKLLEHLTTRDDPATLEALQNVVILIDP